MVHLWVRSSQDFDTNNFDARAGFAYDWFTCVGLPMDWDTNPSPGTQSFRFSFLPFFLHLFWHVGASNPSNKFDRWIKSEIVSAYSQLLITKIGMLGFSIRVEMQKLEEVRSEDYISL